MDFSKRFLIIILFTALSIFIGATQYFASIYFWYFEYWWLDIIMHFLGGVWISLIAMIILSFSGFPSFSLKVTSLIVFLSIVIIGVSWELFEYYLGVAAFHGENYSLDTTIDLILDLFGAFVGTKAFLWYTKEE